MNSLQSASPDVRALNPGLFSAPPTDGTIRLTIYTEPVAKGRPRLTVVNGHGRAYTPAATRNAEAMIRYAITEQYRNPPFAEGVPLKLTVCFYRSRPPSLPKRVTMPVSKPDVDNLAKLLCDAMNGYLIHDDNQLCDLVMSKRFGSPPRIEMTLEPIDPCYEKAEPRIKKACTWHSNLPRYEKQEGYPPGFEIVECAGCGGRFVTTQEASND